MISLSVIKKIISAIVVSMFVLLAILPMSASANSSLFYRDPLIMQRADPQIYKHTDGYYYFMASVPSYDKLELRKSRTLTGIASATAQTIWTRHADGIMSRNIWAPEIYYINGSWYVYFSAGSSTNPMDCRVYVLQNTSADPTQGTWVEKGQLHLGVESFQIDATYFENNGQGYLLWSGVGDNGNSIYIEAMTDPLTPSGTPVLLSEPTLSWERLPNNPVDEGPQVIQRNGKVFITYSGSFCDENYAVGLLTASDSANMLDQSSWTKAQTPVFSSNPTANVYGPGHNGFASSPDGTEDYIIYHGLLGTGSAYGCGSSRNIRIQKFTWNADGTPNFGVPVSAGTVMATPSGENRFEGEYADVFAGLTKVVSWPGASNGKVAGYLNSSSSYIQINNVNVPAAGTYTLTIRYDNASAGGASASHYLSINGGSNLTVNYPNTGSAWGTFSTVQLNADLNAGNNTLKFTYANQYAEIDYVQVDVPQYEAETATVNHATVLSDSTVSGDKMVGYIDYSDSYVQFIVNVPTARTYTLAATYSNGYGSAATHQVSVNGAAAGTLNYPNSSWNNWQTVSVDIPLQAGNNTIRIAKGTNYAQLDYIQLYSPIVSGSAHKLLNRSSGKALDVVNGSTADGGNVQQWDDLNNTVQKWTFTADSSGYYTIINVNSGKALEIAGSSLANGGNVDQSTDVSGDHQKWRVEYVGNGTYKLTNKNSGKVLDLTDANPESGANVQQWNDDSNDAQKWVIE